MTDIVALNQLSSRDVQTQIAKSMKTLRLSQGLTIRTLETRSGVPYGSIIKFESSGEVSLKSLLKIAESLGVLHKFEELLTEQDRQITVQELNLKLAKVPPRIRGSK